MCTSRRRLFPRVQRTSLGGKDVMSLMSAIQKLEKTKSKRNQVVAELVLVVLFSSKRLTLDIKCPLRRTDQKRKHETFQ